MACFPFAVFAVSEGEKTQRRKDAETQRGVFQRSPASARPFGASPAFSPVSGCKAQDTTIFGVSSMSLFMEIGFLPAKSGRSPRLPGSNTVHFGIDFCAFAPLRLCVEFHLSGVSA